jgi:phenylacetate-CoA ligase
MPIREAQIIQEAIDRLVVKVVPGAGYSPATAAEVIARLRDRVGDLRVDIEVVASIPRSANGKFRAVVSKVRTSPPTTTPAGL